MEKRRKKTGRGRVGNEKEKDKSARWRVADIAV